MSDTNVYDPYIRARLGTAAHGSVSRVVSLCIAFNASVYLNLRTATSHKRAAVPRRARVEGAKTLESLNSRLESDKDEKKNPGGWAAAAEGRPVFFRL